MFANKKELAYAGESSIPTLKLIDNREFGEDPNATYYVDAGYRVYLLKIPVITQSQSITIAGFASLGAISTSYNRDSSSRIRGDCIAAIRTDQDDVMYFQFGGGTNNVVLNNYEKYNEVHIQFLSSNITHMVVQVYAA